ncbi:MAG: hypothetical protein ABEI86_06845 [Halobacteriaceae archaeon]
MEIHHCHSSRKEYMNKQGATNANITSPKPTEIFGLLAHETRMTAMQVLWEAGEPLGFSEITTRGNIDDTSNFNYHLGELQPQFIRQVSNGYTLTRTGQRVLTAVLAGRFVGHESFDEVVVDYDCPFCGEDLTLNHSEEALRVSCTGCPGIYRGRNGNERITKIWLPPAGVRENPSATLDIGVQWTYARNWSFARGICPECAGSVSTRVNVCRDHTTSNGLCDNCQGRYRILAHHECNICHENLSILPVVSLLTEPRIRKFYHRHGPDPLAFTFESMASLVPYEERITSYSPIEFVLEITRNNTTLEVTADEHLDPIAITLRE